MNTHPAESHLFTLRLWPEPRAGGETAWRGKVTHVLSGETRYFRDWARLLEFLSSVPVELTDAPTDQHVMSYHILTIQGDSNMSEEYAQRHCLMISVDAGEGTTGSASIIYLDWLDAQGNPHWEDLGSKYEGFKKLGDDGWKLVQVIERPAAEGMDGPIPPMTHQYFTRAARPRG